MTHEARTAGTDLVAQRRFGRYWRLVRPFVGYIPGRVLARIDAGVDVDIDVGTGTDAGGRRRSSL